MQSPGFVGNYKVGLVAFRFDIKYTNIFPSETYLPYISPVHAGNIYTL
jgi:hypothetical protein